MLKDMLTPEDVHVGVVLDEYTKDAAIKKAASLCTASGACVEDLCQAFFKREAEDSTGFGGGVAIPHAKITGPVTPKVVFVRFAEPIDWGAIDDQPVTVAICLVMPETDKDNTHLVVISHFARKLASAEFVQNLTSIADPRELYDYIIENVED